jgi:hypothetical protein
LLGTHSELMKMAFSDYQQLVEPTVFTFSQHL